MIIGHKMTIKGIMFRTLIVALICLIIINEPKYLKYYSKTDPTQGIILLFGFYWLIFEVFLYKIYILKRD